MQNYVTRTALLGGLLLASAIAHAQFAWIDEKGVRHYSDQPPPTTTPEAKILKVPRGMARPGAATGAPAPATPAPAPPVKPLATVAEREADYAKRKALAADTEKKAAAEKQLADATRARCSSAVDNKAKLTSGQAILTAQNTEMPAADRARELATAEKILKDCR